MKFKGTLVKEDGKYILKGDLTIRDVTRPESFAVTYVGDVKDSTPEPKIIRHLLI